MKKQNQLKINEEIAIQICEEIRTENKKKKFSFLKLFCRFCKGNCFSSDEFNRGCYWINKRFDKMVKD